MDTIQHGTHGLLIAAVIDATVAHTLPVGVYLAGAAGGIAADIAGEAERIFKDNRKLWTWYNICHKWEAVWWMTIGMFAVAVTVSSGITVINATIAFAAAYALHLYLDRHTHISMGARRNWYPPAEMCRRDYWGAVRYCWPNWIGWGATALAAWVIL